MTAAEIWSRDDILSALEQVAQTGEPSPGTARMLDVGSEEFVRHFEFEILNDFVRHGGATCRVFEGSYGAGKTHLLDLLHDAAQRQGMAVVRTMLSDALSLEDWRLITQHVLQRIELTINGEKVRSLPRILESLAREGVLARRLDGPALPHPGTLRAMQLLLSGDALRGGRALLHQFLLGEKVTVKALRAEGISGVRPPLTARNAELVLKTALAALRRLGVPGTVLMFDENEKTFVFHQARPPKKVVQGANLLRRLIDASATGGLEGTVAVFAVLQGFIEHCALAYPALGQRLHVQLSDSKVSWRWPVLRLDHVTGNDDRNAFLDGVVARLELLAKQAGHATNGLGPSLHAAGRSVLQANAGGEYRRHLMRRLCTIVVQEI